MNKKSFWGIIVVLLISGLVLYFDLKETPVKVLAAAAKQINLGKVALVFLAMLLSYLCEALILRLLAKRPSEAKRSFWSYLRIPLIQALFNGITPMATGGQPSQLAAMAEMGMPIGRSTSILMMKFICYQLVVLAAYLTAFASGFSLVASKFAGLAIFIFIGFALHVSSIILLLLAMFAHDWTRRMVKKLMAFLGKFLPKDKVQSWEEATLAQVESFYQESQALKKEKQKLWGVIPLTILQLLCYYSAPYLTLYAFGLSVSYFQVTIMTILIIMFMAVIPVPGASGGAEFSFQTLFASFIAKPGLVVAAMFVWRFATYFFGMILGIFAWSIKPAKIRE
ncbi:lysylphosphatidylglycerol synthase transmembrane domain-containing protein [Lactobacillus equicursoris]|uniref:lysylphosphatidylglycerol synthase transmembrane domain-containing protein n=1 Tax=Lactobacillus equicursoris TaxID=420645 RepID=UPI0039961A84